VPQQLLDLFPLTSLPPDGTETYAETYLPTDKVKHIQSMLRWNKPFATSNDKREDLVRPGTLYRRYRTVDDLPKLAKSFYEKAGTDNSHHGFSSNVVTDI
jgi:RNA polymerase I-specific transcription initiation factor RRN7